MNGVCDLSYFKSNHIVVFEAMLVNCCCAYGHRHINLYYLLMDGGTLCSFMFFLYSCDLESIPNHMERSQSIFAYAKRIALSYIHQMLLHANRQREPIIFSRRYHPAIRPEMGRRCATFNLQ